MNFDEDLRYSDDSIRDGDRESNESEKYVRDSNEIDNMNTDDVRDPCHKELIDVTGLRILLKDVKSLVWKTSLVV